MLLRAVCCAAISLTARRSRLASRCSRRGSTFRAGASASAVSGADRTSSSRESSSRKYRSLSRVSSACSRPARVGGRAARRRCGSSPVRGPARGARRPPGRCRRSRSTWASRAPAQRLAQPAQLVADRVGRAGLEQGPVRLERGTQAAGGDAQLVDRAGVVGPQPAVLPVQLGDLLGQVGQHHLCRARPGQLLAGKACAGSGGTASPRLRASFEAAEAPARRRPSSSRRSTASSTARSPSTSSTSHSRQSWTWTRTVQPLGVDLVVADLGEHRRRPRPAARAPGGGCSPGRPARADGRAPAPAPASSSSVGHRLGGHRRGVGAAPCGCPCPEEASGATRRRPHRSACAASLRARRGRGRRCRSTSPPAAARRAGPSCGTPSSSARVGQDRLRTHVELALDLVMPH